MALLLLQLLYYACYYLLLALQLCWYALLDQRCLTVGWLGVDHHWPARQFEWRNLLWDFCSVRTSHAGL
jgi:hypothetical protein